MHRTLAALTLAAATLAIVTLVQAAPALGADAAETLKGFNGLAWGAKPKDLPGALRLKEKGDAAFYINAQEDFALEEAKTHSLLYGFFKDRFYAAFIRIHRQETFEKVMADLDAKHGRRQTKGSGRNVQHIWRLENVKIKLKDVRGDMKLAYYYTPLSEQVTYLSLEDLFDELEAQELEEGSLPSRQASPSEREESIVIYEF